MDNYLDDGDSSVADIDKTSLRDCMASFRRSFMNGMAKTNRFVMKCLFLMLLILFIVAEKSRKIKSIN